MGKFNSLANDVAIFDHLDNSQSNAGLNFRKNNSNHTLKFKDDNGNYFTSSSVTTITDFACILSVVFDYNNMIAYFYLDGQLINSTISQSSLINGINPEEMFKLENMEVELVIQMV